MDLGFLITPIGGVLVVILSGTAFYKMGKHKLSKFRALIVWLDDALKDDKITSKEWDEGFKKAVDLVK